MAAEIVAAGIHTVGAEAPMVAEVEVDLVAEIAEDSVAEVVVLPNQASQLDVTSAETPARFPLSQTEASRSCAVTVSEETKAVAIHEALIEPHRLDGSTTDPKIDHDGLHQVQPPWAQA